MKTLLHKSRIWELDALAKALPAIGTVTCNSEFRASILLYFPGHFVGNLFLTYELLCVIFQELSFLITSWNLHIIALYRYRVTVYVQ